MKTGALKARRLSVVTGIPRTKIYAALRRLIDMGLVVEVPETPRRFVPTPPVKAFEGYLKAYERKTQSLFAIISSLGKVFDEANNGNVPQKSVNWVIRGKRKIFEKIEEMLSGAQKDVEIATDEKRSVLFYKRFNKLLDRLTERSVWVRFFTRFGDFNRYVMEQLQYVAEIADAEIFLPLVFVDVDEKNFLIAVMESHDECFNFETETAVFSENRVLAKIIQTLLARNKSNFTVIRDLLGCR